MGHRLLAPVIAEQYFAHVEMSLEQRIGHEGDALVRHGEQPVVHHPVGVGGEVARHHAVRFEHLVEFADHAFHVRDCPLLITGEHHLL